MGFDFYGAQARNEFRTKLIANEPWLQLSEKTSWDLFNVYPVDAVDAFDYHCKCQDRTHKKIYAWVAKNGTRPQGWMCMVCRYYDIDPEDEIKDALYNLQLPKKKREKVGGTHSHIAKSERKKLLSLIKPLCIQEFFKGDDKAYEHWVKGRVEPRKLTRSQMTCPKHPDTKVWNVQLSIKAWSCTKQYCEKCDRWWMPASKRHLKPFIPKPRKTSRKR